MTQPDDARTPVHVIESGVWQMLQADSAYPTIVGAHDELIRWRLGLEDLADRLEATIPYVAQDIEGLDGGQNLHLHEAYSHQQAALVRTAAALLGQACTMSVSRFST